MGKRVFGLRNEYSVVLSASGPRPLSPQEAWRRLFGPVVSGGQSGIVRLRNGGQLYLDMVGRPEYGTPDCGNALDLVVHDKAGERILEGLLEDAGRRLREEGIAGAISVLKSNAGPAGSAYGCQENYQVSGRVEFGRLADILIPFLVTRQLICGAGTIARASRGAVYCLSRPAGRTRTSMSSAITRPRPFLRTRDEPRAATGVRRLGVMVSDPAMSETTTLLKAGTTDLVLRMAEAAAVMPDLALDNPVQAIADVSRDLTGRSRVWLAGARASVMGSLDVLASGRQAIPPACTPSERRRHTARRGRIPHARLPRS